MLMHAINYVNHMLTWQLTHQLDRFIYVVSCRHQTTTYLIYKMWPPLNLLYYYYYYYWIVHRVQWIK